MTRRVRSIAPLNVVFRRKAIIALIRGRANFLPLRPVSVRFRAVLRDRVFLTSAGSRAIFLSRVNLRQRYNLALMVSVLRLSFKNIRGHLYGFRTQRVRTRAIDLRRHHLSVGVRRRSQRAVALAVRWAVNIVILASNRASNTTRIVDRP